MKIAKYNIQQKSAHQLEKRKEAAEKLESWTGRRNAVKEEPTFLLDIGASRKAYELTAEKTCLKDNNTEESAKDQETDVKLKLIESFVYMTTGKRIRLKAPEIDLEGKKTAVAVQSGSPVTDDLVRDGWGLVYEYHEVSQEKESLHFHSAGSVQTSDGHLISFDLDFNMSRTYIQENNISLRFGDAARVDPLVIALKGGAPELSRDKQAFDLDGDGDTENVSFATGDSGFLAFDKNGDGIINDGTELFGPETGNGFAELAAYDLDKNGWIDEADDVFGMLSILTLAENGEKTLFKVGEAGVGAIYLQDISTLFGFKDGLNVYGEMKSSSIYLNEDGTAGTIHHVDLSV